MKSVCDFHSYREFLKATYESIKKDTPNMSLEKYARSLGLTSSTLKMIMTNKRNLTPSRMHLVGQRLKLSAIEQEYFEALVLKEQMKNEHGKNFYAKKSRSVKAKTKLQSNSLSKKELLSDPYILPVLVYLTDFEMNKVDSTEQRTREIAELFGVDQRKIEMILSVLESSDVTINNKPPHETHYVFSKLNHVINQKIFLKRWLIESAQHLETSYSDDRTLFNASTISLPATRLGEMKEEIKLIFEKYMTISSVNQEKDMIVQACVQIFPILEK